MSSHVLITVVNPIALFLSQFVFLCVHILAIVSHGSIHQGCHTRGKFIATKEMLWWTWWKGRQEIRSEMGLFSPHVIIHYVMCNILGYWSEQSFLRRATRKKKLIFTLARKKFPAYHSLYPMLPVFHLDCFNGKLSRCINFNMRQWNWLT